MVSLDFWTDPKVDDEFTPEDKYFMLYLLTNPHTRLCGCYEISYKQMERETGYNVDTVKRILDRLENVHKVISFDEDTKEVLIYNWGKYNWVKSEKVYKGVLKDANAVKNDKYRYYIVQMVNAPQNVVKMQINADYKQFKGENTQKTAQNSLKSSQKTANKDDLEQIRLIIDYLNNHAQKAFKTSENSKKWIRARINEGYSIEDFKKVIDIKCEEWLNTNMEQYLRPSTLFGNKFESYLNQKPVKKSNVVISKPIYKQNEEVEEKYKNKTNEQIIKEFKEMQNQMNGK